MGFLSKVWKGLKKGFKKIGRGIKKGFAKFGKFMNKLGIAGQIGMMFLMPGIGNAMMSTFGSVMQGLGAAAQAGGVLGNIAGAAQTVLGAAGNFARLVAKPFTTITEGVTSFLSNTTKYLGQKMGIQTAYTMSGPTTFLGTDGVIGRTGANIANNVRGFGEIAQDLVTGDVSAFTDRSFGALKQQRLKEEALQRSRDLGVTYDSPETERMFRQQDFVEGVESGIIPEGSTMDFETGRITTPTGSPVDVGTAVTEKSLLDRVVDPFRPSNLIETTAQGVGQGVSNVASSYALQTVGLGPEEIEYDAPSQRYTPEFRSDQSYLAMGITPVNYNGFISGITQTNSPAYGGYGGSQNYNAWMQRAVA